MIKLSDYISEQIDLGQRKFDLGIEMHNGVVYVNEQSPNRVKFEVGQKRMSFLSALRQIILRWQRLLSKIWR